ncbi:NAD-dependent epimerase/dehydratase family protein [Photobacterium andalusiense]|uniref:GDP-6-deoxy-D-talose 4-dehydrogenase n=1 Tax=Photobacterium andalusiense TaxID=2204296 RepID=A0A1Y6MHD6_9GAMM|nr:NAD-dependent epimerase/dehydratase family protein [Photobacterium andalusiense]SMY35953.1 GDP-6-deoxy-D-talose 4-dehydrogenase [Photobacterium andalusiense]
MLSKVLLTGSTGFIGRNYYNAYSNNIRRIVRKPANNDANDTYLIESLTSKTDWKEALTDVDSVIHLAGLAHSKSYSNDDYTEINYLATVNLAKQAANAGVKKFIFISTIGVNGVETKDEPFRSSDMPNPHNSYATSKYHAEIDLKKISEESGMKLVIIRPTLVYGADAPGNYKSLLSLVKKTAILPFKAIHNERSFISIHNLCSLINFCLNSEEADGQIILASDGYTVSISEFTNTIAENLGRKLYQIPIPRSFFLLLGRLFNKEQMIGQLINDLKVDDEETRNKISWRPTKYKIETK